MATQYILLGREQLDHEVEGNLSKFLVRKWMTPALPAAKSIQP